MTPIELDHLLKHDDSSVRLQAALKAGTHPDGGFLEPLIARCAIEPDFYVRDMLTWTLTRLGHEAVLARVIEETRSDVAQARSQALHTLSKLADERAWPAITSAHLHDDDDEVARAAWRTAAGLVPYDERGELARELTQELGRGSLEVMRSLSRAFVELDHAAEPSLEAATLDDGVNSALKRKHAAATLLLMADPEATFVIE